MKLASSLVFLLLCSTPGFAKQMDVFTNDAYGANSLKAAVSQGWNVRLYNMDEYLKVKKEMSFSRPNTESQARALAKEKMKKVSVERLRTSLHGAMKAIQFDIRKIPAVVFNDGEAVVYGVRDIDVAINMYEQWRKNGAREKKNGG